MPRKIAAWPMMVAIFGRCSEISMPGTLVLIGLNSPASLVPGFMSKVSLWLGPPSIHRRMHDLVLARVSAAWAASGASQPEIDGASTPSDDRRRKSRRGKELNMGLPHITPRLPGGNAILLND